MKRVRAACSRFSGLFQKRARELEMSAELQAHVDGLTERNLAAGMSPEEARSAAQRAFGGMEQIKERCRDERRSIRLEQAWRDVGFASRALGKAPGFTATAGVTLALGIGACTAMFSLVNGLVLQPLPYDDPGQLVQLWEDPSGNGTARNTIAGGVLNAWQEASTAFDGIAAIGRITANLTGTERPVRLDGLRVSPAYLHLLRLTPAHGRDFQPQEGQPGQNAVVILTHAAWQKHFGGRPDLVGQSLRLGPAPVTVVGILPPAARLTADVDFLFPFAYGTPGWNRAFAGHILQAIGRLRPGATIEQARQEMAVITDRQRNNYPPFKRNWGVLLVPMHEEVTGDVRPQLLLLLGATGCVLLVACANVAGLLLARGVSREKEMAMRLTLGASRWAIGRLILTENLLLSGAGCLLGVLLAHWTVAGFEHWRPANLVPGLAVSLDARAVGFAVALSLLAGLFTGLVPAWRLARFTSEELKNGSRSSTGAVQTRLRSTLIIGQVALSLVLLIGAGLLLRSLVRLQAVPIGFDPSGVLLADLTLESPRLRDAGTRAEFLDEVVHHVAAVPGVTEAAIASVLPLQSSYTETVTAEGTTEPRVLTVINFVTGPYFPAMRIPLHRGRALTAADNRPDAAPVAVVNAHLAAQLFPNQNPIGRGVRLLDQTYEIVGLTDDVLAWGVQRGAIALIYLPEAASRRFSYRGANASLVVRTTLPPLALAKSVEAAVLATAADQPLANVRTYDGVLAQFAFTRRLMLGLLGAFAAVALALAAIGLYGILAFTVDRRRRELGIRLALGATRRNLVQLVISGGLKLTAAGVVLGLLAGSSLTRFIASQLYAVSPLDPLTIGSVTLLLLIAALLACWLPARRAARVDPVIALRAE